MVIQQLVPATCVINLALDASHQQLTVMPVRLITTLFLLPSLLHATCAILLVTNALDLATPIVKLAKLLTYQLINILQRVLLNALSLLLIITRTQGSVKNVQLNVALVKALPTPTAIPVKRTTTK